MAQMGYSKSIGTILGQVNKDKKPFAMAVFLLVFLVVSGVVYSPRHGQPTVVRGILGGPRELHAPSGGILGTLAFSEEPVVSNYSSEGHPFPGNQADQGILAASLNDGDVSSGLADRESLLVYRVRRGDTLSGIASYFGVSLDTIVNANPNIRARFLRAGDELNILPTSGIVYRVHDGDTFESVASYFNVPENNIAKFNRSVNFAVLGAGVSLVIPGVKNSGLALGRGSLPNFDDNFVKPADGFNWGILHHYNAVDIANTCGTPVVAAAEGLVVPDESFGDGKGGWNGGYGSFVLIEHPFGDSVRTRYAHLAKVLVDIGDYVKRGQQIGTMGETGDASGCHVHFEVYGAQNPLAR